MILDSSISSSNLFSFKGGINEYDFPNPMERGIPYITEKLSCYRREVFFLRIAIPLDFFRLGAEGSTSPA